MLELKELLTEWKTVPQLMGMDDSLAPVLEKDGTVNRHRGKRNSPLDLQQMYRQQLTNLWSTVDGSSKFFTITPGRRLVFETHSFVELNAATYKAKQNVSLFLLNDLLLVAGRRRTKAPPGMGNDPDFERGRMVAERCWVLTDLIVVDLKDSGDLTNALKIKRNKEVCVYRGQRPEDKKALLGAFKQVSSELSEKKRKDNEAEQERRRTLWQGENPGGSRLTMAMSMWGGDQGSARPITTIGTSLTDSKELTWIDEFGDDLTMAIATQDWEKGVALAERGTDLLRTVANNAEATELLQFKLDTLKPNLVKQIARDLSSPKIRKTSASHLIGLLSRLDSAELARDTFLKARHDLMVSLVRGIKHEGDISLYISELSVVCFTIIRHTSDWYMNAFKGNSMASGECESGGAMLTVQGFTTWAKTQVEYFGDIFRRQVYAPTIDESVVSECLKVTMSANRKLLRDAGLDFTFLLNSVTSSDPEPAPAGFSAAPISAGPPTTFAAMNAGRKVSTGRGDGGYSPLSPGSESGPASLFGRRPRPDGRNVSGASAFSNANSSSASPPRPPPRSERRSRVPGEP
jgi:hypothetical protein